MSSSRRRTSANSPAKVAEAPSLPSPVDEEKCDTCSGDGGVGTAEGEPPSTVGTRTDIDVLFTPTPFAGTAASVGGLRV
jgi:hypothetical protein